MSNIFCVTNRKLCQGDFLKRIEQIAACRPKGMILREKDLTPEEYRKTAIAVMEICSRYGVKCILHSFYDIAISLQADALHLPLHLLKKMSKEERGQIPILGASCHSIEEALKAQALGCTYITAGHIFDTNCKKGLPGRGIQFLQNVCEAVKIPVYGIGGIDVNNISQIWGTGAKGVCLMSSLMISDDIEGLMKDMEGQCEI